MNRHIIHTLLACFIAAGMSACGEEPQASSAQKAEPAPKVYGVYRHAYVATIGDGKGVEGKNGHLPFGTECGLTKGGSVTELGWTNHGQAFRYDGKGAEGPLPAITYVCEGLRGCTTKPVQVDIREQCPPEAVVIIQRHDVYSLVEWHRHQEKIESFRKTKQQ